MNHRAIVSTLSLLTVFGASSVAGAQRRTSPRASVDARSGDRTPRRLRLDGTLSERDRSDAEGRHFRARRLSLHRGDQVSFSLNSGAFDTVARVEGPDGARWSDDDGAGEGTDSLLRFTAPEDGSYTFIASSYAASEVGRFQAVIEIRPGAGEDGWDDEAQPEEARRDESPEDRPIAPANAPANGRTFGIFVGISDYQGENNNLPGSAGDAVNLARAFQRAGWMQRTNAVVLTDREATAANVRQAFRAMAPRVSANDTFVFFFDGHGASNAIDLRGPDLSRSDLGRMMDGVRGRQLLVLDSCSAGGFSPLVRGRANRAGLFSSRADQTSSTAPAVGAGGWLAYGFTQAVNGGVQRRDDGSLDFDEVVGYVRDQYRTHRVDQELVAVNGGRGDFALGGNGDGGSAPTDTTAVASNEAPQGDSFGGLPAFIPMIPGLVNGIRLPTASPGSPMGPLFGSDDQFAALLGSGVRAAGAVLEMVAK